VPFRQVFENVFPLETVLAAVVFGGWLVVVTMAAAFAASSMESSIGVGQSILTAAVTMP
jgi:hypothetical protein